jgi:gliding motility-associated-like protein
MTYTTNYLSNNTAFAEFDQLQDDDPSVDSCLGVDTAFISTLPFTVTPSNWQWKNIINNPVLSSPSVITVTDFLVQKELVCGNISYCDSIKIYGPDTICVLGQETDFTARTNNGCNKRIQWRLNAASYLSCNQVNDSTLRVRFQNFGGAGSHSLWLYAYASNCGTIKDSLKVTLFPVPTPLSSSGTLKLCPGDTLKLSPGNWFKSYLWQDGSTDSVYKATSPGLYKVRIEAVCGYVIYESVLITSPLLSLGNDTIKCNADTVVISATGGFSNYTWQPGNNMIAIADSAIKVFPTFSQQYTVTADAYPGCMIKDTIFIEVRQSPVIDLGNDTSFCKTSFLVLRAANEFDSYLWNTGETSDSIKVSEEGTYFISATYNNGCISKDTIRILKTYDLPVVNLNASTILCKEQNDYLDAGPGFLSYLWQDGSTNRKYKVTVPGTYSVRVSDNNNCFGSVTVVITKIVLPPSGFLGKDTSLCEGGSVTLMPNNTFISYLWNNGSSSSNTIVRREGIYTLNVNDNLGCTGTDTIIVNKKNCPNSFYVPTGFTPNNDGKNDLFKPIITGALMSYEFSIYNRWGQRVFLSGDKNIGWDGTVKGLNQDGNVFVWTCKYQFYNQQPEAKKGTVILIR